MLQALIWSRLLAAVLGGAALGIGAVTRRTIATLKGNWNLVDDLTGQVRDPNEATGQFMEVPLGDKSVRLEYRGKLRARWEQLDPAERRRLLVWQGGTAWLGLVILILALAPFGPRSSFIVALGAAATGFLLANLLGHTKLLAPDSMGNRNLADGGNLERSP